MKETTIYDFDTCPVNERNGTYGGKAGDKEGITINGEYWIVKYPKSTVGMRGDLTSYTTSPLSEYIGSNIYQMLNIEAHDTLLGTRNNKLVVACKDFCKNEGSLREMRTLRNVYNKELSKELERFSSTSASHLIDIDATMLHLELNPVLQKIDGIKERFWEQLLVDALINNNDRNNGNWGVLYEDGQYRLAPVFDNGAAFSNKLPDYKLELQLINPAALKQSIDGQRTIYQRNDIEIGVKDIPYIEDDGLYTAAKKIIPLMERKMSDISQFIRAIPAEHNGLYVCSDIRKDFYIKSMEMRLEQYLMPTLRNAQANVKTPTYIGTQINPPKTRGR